MTDRTLFFNGNFWRGILKSEQGVRFLEELWRRAGGAQPPTQDLGEVVTNLTQIDQSVSGLGQGLQQVRRIAAQLVNESERNNASLRAHIKKLEHRINQLEDAQ